MPLLLTSMVNCIAKQNLWGERHLSMMAMPYFIFLGLSITLLPSPFVKIAFRCVLLAWAIVASATFLAVTDKMFHWEAIAKEIATRDPASIYATEQFIILPLEYHLEHSAGRAVKVSEKTNLSEIGDQRFWFVYRKITWEGQPPQSKLQALHDTIDGQVSTRVGDSCVCRFIRKDEITALLVHTAPRPIGPSQ